MGTSDIHGLIDWAHDVPYGHRPITLVFAKTATADAIHEGLSNRRTVVVHNNLLIGRDEFLIPLVEASLKVDTAYYAGKTDVLTVVLKNGSSSEFTLQNKSGYTLHEHSDLVTIKAGEKQNNGVQQGQRLVLGPQSSRNFCSQRCIPA